MNVPRSSVVPGCRRLALLVGAAMTFVSHTSAADSWYEHYAQGEQAIAAQEWALAIEEINNAIGRKGDSGARARSYGMNVVAYFPYLKLGIAYYHLGQFDAALQAFETEARLGAIAESAVAGAELERYRALAEGARLNAVAEAEQRILEIVRQSMEEARGLEDQGLLNEAAAVLGRALAVAPDDVDATEAMQQLRERIAGIERERERDQRAADLVETGKILIEQGKFGEASSLFREAQFLKPGPAIQALLGDARGRLLAELEGGEVSDDWQSTISAWVLEVEQLEAAGELLTALDRLQQILVLEPSHSQALAIQERVLNLREAQESELARQASIGELLADARGRIDSGAMEEALAAANRVLALDPGNETALGYVAQAYGVLSRRLLGTSARSNIPPAVSFVDLRSENEAGLLIETVNDPGFRLSGVVIDESPVELAIRDGNDKALEINLASQPLGEFFITEFNVTSKLQPGRSVFRLMATDSEDLTSSSEYAVIYLRPWFRAPWFPVLPVVALAAIGGTLLWHRGWQRERLRKRRFNPYVAGAPVVSEDMFFGRRELVDRILQTIHNNSLLIYGERRIGKTSIQHQIRRRLAELDDPDYTFYPVYVDLQGTPQNQFFRTIADDIFEQLEPVLGGLGSGRNTWGDYSYRDLVADIRAVLKRLATGNGKQVRLVLLIDEVDELNDYDPRINQKLRSLFMKSFAENLVAVVSGVEIKKQWEREGSPWYNFFEEIEVKPLEPQYARELIERPIGGIFKVDGGAAERIINLTAGKPYLIQKMCIALVTRLHEQHRRKITLADVEAIAGANRA